MNLRGEKRSNETHEPKTDPDSLLARKSVGKESRLSYSGNLSVENRNGLIVDAEVFQANGTAERDAALVMMEWLGGRPIMNAACRLCLSKTSKCLSGWELYVLS